MPPLALTLWAHACATFPVGLRFAAWGPEQLQIIPTTIEAFDVDFAADAAGELLFELDEPHPLSARAVSAHASTAILIRVNTSSLLS
jgi:hypothetical protein